MWSVMCRMKHNKDYNDPKGNANQHKHLSLWKIEIALENVEMKLQQTRYRQVWANEDNDKETTHTKQRTDKQKWEHIIWAFTFQVDTKYKHLTQGRSVTVRPQASHCWRPGFRMQAKAVRIKIYHIHQLAVITTSRTGLIQQIHHLVRSNQIPANIINDCYYGTVEDINVMNAIHTAWSNGYITALARDYKMTLLLKTHYMRIEISNGHKKQQLTQVRSVTVRQQASRCWRTWYSMQVKDAGNTRY